MSELADLTAVELVEAYRTRETAPTEVTRALLERLHGLEPLIQSVVTLRTESANVDAEAADRRWREGTARPLEGVPFGAKDSMSTHQIRTTFGLERFKEFIPGSTEPSVQRLQDAGAILLAKLQVDYRRANPGPFGTARNPWNAVFGVGGSSSGSAAAVAAHELPLALATDGLGSVRLPSAWAGIVGFKPTFGHVPLLDRSLLTVPGPMARTVADCDLALSSMAPRRARASDKRPIAGMRLGVPENFFFDICDGEIRQAVDDAIRCLQALGASIQAVRIAHAHLIGLIGLITLLVPESIVSGDAHHLPLSARRGVAWARSIAASDYEVALRARHLIQLEFASAFQSVDAIILPGAIALAPRLDDQVLLIDGVPYNYSAAFRVTAHANVTGMPALAIPCGLSKSGLPIGLQICGPANGDQTCLDVGRAFQSATNFHNLVPPVVREYICGRRIPAPRDTDYSRHVPTVNYGGPDMPVDVTRAEGSRESRDGEADEQLVLDYVERSYEFTPRPLAELRALGPTLAQSNSSTAVRWLEQTDS